MRNKYEEYGYELLRIGKYLELRMTSERDFTEEETIEALEWLVFEQRLNLREAEEPQ